ncbi:MAG: hypothetical protein KDE28_00475, partial [Anaerolineales bacterium]|nr:hypothetical protein [Anaerolineales bacterium]
MKLSGSTSPFLPAVLIANGSFLLGLFYLYALAAAEFDQDTAARTVFYLAAAPAALFFSAFYTEGLYTLLIAATFYHSRAGDWLKAALFGALAAATRNTGILAALIIALEGLHQQGLRFHWPARGHWGDYLRQSAAAVARSWPSLAAATFVGTGLLAYIVYLNSEFGDPLAFITVQQTWGREIGAGSFLNLVPNTVRELNLGGGLLTGRFNPIIIPDALFTLLTLPLLLWLPRVLRPAHVAFCWATFLIPLSTGTVTSMSRYVLMLLPVFMVLGHAGRRPWLDRLILTLFLPLMAYVSILYSHWYFAG